MVQSFVFTLGKISFYLMEDIHPRLRTTVVDDTGKQVFWRDIQSSPNEPNGDAHFLLSHTALIILERF
jgi:hypothetical protein